MSEEFTEATIREALFELSKKLNKVYRNQPISICIVGGSALILNHSFRDCTQDVDIIKERMFDVKSCGNEVAEKLNLPYDWINDNVMYSKSYSNKILKYKTSYKKMYNLQIYTVEDICILCMKLIAYREGTHDKEDIENLLRCNNFSKKDIMDTLTDLYGQERADSLSELVDAIMGQSVEPSYTVKQSLYIHYVMETAHIDRPQFAVLEEVKRSIPTLALKQFNSEEEAVITWLPKYVELMYGNQIETFEKWGKNS